MLPFAAAFIRALSEFVGEDVVDLIRGRHCQASFEASASYGYNPAYEQAYEGNLGFRLSDIVSSRLATLEIKGRLECWYKGILHVMKPVETSLHNLTIRYMTSLSALDLMAYMYGMGITVELEEVHSKIESELNTCMGNNYDEVDTYYNVKGLRLDLRELSNMVSRLIAGAASRADNNMLMRIADLLATKYYDELVDHMEAEISDSNKQFKYYSNRFASAFSTYNCNDITFISKGYTGFKTLTVPKIKMSPTMYTYIKIAIGSRLTISKRFSITLYG